MQLKSFALLLILSSFLVKTSIAQNCDPWIVQIYKELYNASPTAKECDIKNYNNGSWNSYNELKGYIKQYKTFGTGQKINLTWKYTPSEVTGDQWITQIYKEEYGRKPNAWEYNIQNYNEGRWGTYDELKNLIRQYQSSVASAGMFLDLYDLGNGRFVVDLKINGKSVAVSMIEGRGGNVVASGGANVIAAGGGNVVASGGANVVASGGANVVASGGANVVAPGGANVVASGGGNVIAPGGGNLVINSNVQGFRPGSIYRIQSGSNRTIKTTGRGGIIIR
jgi:hypothetical protein